MTKMIDLIKKVLEFEKEEILLFSVVLMIKDYNYRR